MDFTNSKKLFEEAQEFIPGGVNSPVRAFKAVGESVQKPIEYYQNNIGGLLALVEVMKEFNYDTALTCTEDLELWTRMAMENQEMAILPECLLIYRLHNKQITSTTDSSVVLFCCFFF